MAEAKDPTIKLFGRTIPLPELTSSSGGPISVGASSSTPLRPYINGSLNQNWPYSPDDSNLYRLGEHRETDKAPSVIKLSDAKQENGAHRITSEEMADRNANAVINDKPQTLSADNESSTSKTEEEEDRNETCNSQEKTLKKPDKILPCPRCNSTDTKFCYFNNYNANQPRHFCKNCKRYWTAGGTMRNIPVGAGPRKNKNSASHHYRHIVVPDGIRHANLKPNGSVLAFGSDTPLCESMASVLNIEERTIQNHAQNGFVKPELRIPASYEGGEKIDEHSSQSPQIPFFSGAPWTPPAFFLPGFPMTFYSALPYWGCALPGTWVTPLTSPPIQTSPYSGPNSQTLGKHSRDENMLTILSSGQEESEKSDNTERCLWIPKTARINDPGEAEKSSIWKTLGIKNDKGDSIRKGSLFKAFISKGDKKNHTSETSSV